MQYRCAHCLALLEQTSDVAAPVCPDHPDGSVQIIPEDTPE